jgi:serine/threonine-protein kinase
MDADSLQRWRLARDAFDTLLDLPACERVTRLDEIHRGDAQLARDLRDLLAHTEFDADADDPPDDAPDRREGTVISGRFRLLRLLGVGGMGEVHLAERTDELDQKVALKLVRNDLPVSIERARREQQILARLTHPHIAGFVDAGITDARQPWFAMEYVDGERITDWCDHHALNLVARARLLAKIARAVQFAHRNLILHRDLKPSNILVDTEGLPKLLDFGIAKLLDGTDSQQTQTLALTPAYAAPEQLRGESATTASDVYQLGLVLYELLAGVPARKAREAARPRGDPQTPLPRLDQAFGTMTVQNLAAAERVAQERGVGIDRLRRSLKGDLGRIVAKATADDARERYDTAQALADDLDRWADGLPVAAHHGSFAYRTRKLIRRHRAAAAIIALLAVGLVATSIVAISRARLEHVQRERAEAQRTRAETLLGFMNDVFRQADPQNAGGAELTPTQMLERAAATVESRTDLDPVTRAALMTQVADTFNSLFLPERALASAQQALDALEPVRDRHPDEYLGSVIVALDALQMLDRSDAQLALVARALPIAQSNADSGHPWMPGLLKFRGAARCSQGDYAACAADLRQSIAGQEVAEGPYTNGLLAALNQLAVLMSDVGNSNEQVRLLRRAVSIAERSPQTLKADLSTHRHNLATGMFSQGHYAEARDLLESLQTGIPGLFGADAGFVASIVRRSLARCHSMLGDYRQAGELIAGVIADLPKGTNVWAARHVTQTRLTAAKIALDLGNTAEALDHVDQAGQAVTSEPRGMDFMRLRVDALRGEVLLRDDRCEPATAVLEPALARIQTLAGNEPNWILAEIEDSLARCALARGDLTAAARGFAAAAGQFSAATGTGSPSTLRSEIHGLWATALATRDASVIERLEERRTALIRVLGTEDIPPIWQLDLLMDRLVSELGHAPIAAARTARAHAGLRALTGDADLASYAGLNSFN